MSSCHIDLHRCARLGGSTSWEESQLCEVEQSCQPCATCITPRNTIASQLVLKGLPRSGRRSRHAYYMGLSSSTMPTYNPETLVRDKLSMRDTCVVFSKSY